MPKANSHSVTTRGYIRNREQGIGSREQGAEDILHCVFCCGFLTCSLLKDKVIFVYHSYLHKVSIREIFLLYYKILKKHRFIPKKCIIFAYEIIVGEYFYKIVNKLPSD